MGNAAAHTRDVDEQRAQIVELAPWFHDLHLPNGLQTAPDHPLGDFPLFKWRLIAPIDPHFVSLLSSYGLLDVMDVVAVHGFPLDWNHWRIDEWPDKIAEIEAVTNCRIWATEVGASTFGADEIQLFGLRRTTELLLDRVERVFWYSLLDLPPAWEATTRHKESEGSSYYRHFYMGLIRADGTPKPAAWHFDRRLGICQWFNYEDHRLDLAVHWLRRLGVTRLRTGISWGDWFRPGALEWFDRQMAALAEFDTTITLCFTPPSRGRRPCHTSPPLLPEEFAYFATSVVERYVPRRGSQPAVERGAGDVARPTTPAATSADAVIARVS